MVALAAVWVALTMIFAAMVLQYLFAANVEQTLRADMAAGLNRLIAVIEPEAETPTISEQLPDPLYSTPFSGRYWQIEAEDNGEMTRSRSLWDFVLETRAAPAAAGESFYQTPGPDGQTLAALTRRVQVEGATVTRPYLVTIAENRLILDQAIERFSRELAITLAGMAVIIIFAAWVQVKLGLLPLKGVRRAIEAIRRGHSDRLDGDYPQELTPLVEEVNDLLLAREKSTEYARSRASDLAHGLKTPLAALHGSADRLRAKGETSEAELLESLSVEMSERIEYQLRLAALRVRSGAHVANASLNSALIRTLTVLKKTGRGENLNWMAEFGADAVIDMDRQDLLELVGIILENASKWARSRVTIKTSQDEAGALVVVADDGPGIPEAKLSELGARGKRLDETRPGTGFGLAIAIEIVRLNEGEIGFGRSEVGGLEVTLRLPLAVTV
jgi:signal transduction histidine kinase